MATATPAKDSGNTEPDTSGVERHRCGTDDTSAAARPRCDTNDTRILVDTSHMMLLTHQGRDTNTDLTGDVPMDYVGYIYTYWHF